MKSVLFLIPILLSGIAWHITTKADAGTHQIADLLLVGNDTLFIFSNPLEQVFGDSNPRPDEFFEDCSSTACWRGYQATWRLEADLLYLVEIGDCCGEDSLPIEGINRLVQGRYRNGKALADWFSGDVLAPQGERLRYAHMGYASIYEREIIFRFEKGRLVSRDTLSNIPTREPRFPGDMRAFQHYVVERVDWGKLSIQEREVLAVVTVDTMGVATVDTVLRAPSAQISDEIRRVVESAPKWEPGYERGKKHSYQWIMPFRQRGEEDE